MDQSFGLIMFGLFALVVFSAGLKAFFDHKEKIKSLEIEGKRLDLQILNKKEEKNG